MLAAAAAAAAAPLPHAGEDVKAYIKQQRSKQGSLTHLQGHVLLLNWSAMSSNSILRQAIAEGVWEGTRRGNCRGTVEKHLVADTGES